MIKEFTRKLDCSVKPVTKYSVNGNRIVLLHEEGFVSVLDMNSLDKLYEFDSGMDAREAFHLPPFGPVLSCFSKMIAFNERKGQLVDDSYYPYLEAIDSSFPINPNCIACAVEWASSYGAPAESGRLSFIKPETLECMESLKRPGSADISDPIVAADGSLFIPCSEGVERYPSFGRRKPHQFADINGQQWAMIDGTSLCYQDFYLSSKYRNSMIGKQGAMIGIDTYKDSIRLTDRLETYSGEYRLPIENDFAITDYYLNGQHLVLKKGRHLIHIDLQERKASLIPVEGPHHISHVEALPYLILIGEQDKCLLYDLNRMKLIEGSLGNAKYYKLTVPREDFFLRSTYSDEKRVLGYIRNDTLFTSILPDEYDSAWDFKAIGQGRILFCMENEMYILHTDQFMEHIENVV